MLLDRYFEPVAATLTPQTAQAIVDLKPDAAVVERIAHLGEYARLAMTEGLRTLVRNRAEARCEYCHLPD